MIRSFTVAHLLLACALAAACTGGSAPSPSGGATSTPPAARSPSVPTAAATPTYLAAVTSPPGAAVCTGEDPLYWDQVPQVGQAYAIAWVGPDPSGRLSLLEESLAEDGTYVSPTMDEPVIGREALAATIDEFHSGANNFFEMRAWNDADYHHDRIRLRWVLCGPAGNTVLEGEDILELDEEGLIQEAIRFNDTT